MLRKFFDYTRGLFILISFYIISTVIIKFLHIMLPPAVLGLVLFATSLIYGLIKEEWIEKISKFLIKNMAMFLVPFVGGLVVYKSLLLKNWFVILFVIFITTTLLIVVTGLFVEYGLKLLKLHKMRKLKQ